MTSKTNRASTRKLPPAKDWRNRHIDDWNVTTFTEYLKDKHRELFGCDYVPFGGRWGFEQGVLGSLIGTKSRKNPKPRRASNAAVKRFIDETFASYKPTPEYPGTSFGFMWTYRRNVWQRIQREEATDIQTEQVEAQQTTDELKEIAEWL